MKAVLQRVKHASVTVGGQLVSSIGQGLLVFLGIGESDESADLEWMVEKIVHLRIFEDENEKMNLSVKDTGGSILLVSQFTLYGDAQKGRRPSFSEAAKPEKAQAFYEACGRRMADHGVSVSMGVFGAMMAIDLLNDGPVTILIDSKR